MKGDEAILVLAKKIITQQYPQPVSPPLTAGELVEITCWPANEEVYRAWDEYVAATKLADTDINLALALTKRAVRHAGTARQHLIVARLVGTVTWVGIPTTTIN